MAEKQSAAPRQVDLSALIGVVRDLGYVVISPEELQAVVDKTAADRDQAVVDATLKSLLDPGHVILPAAALTRRDQAVADATTKAISEHIGREGTYICPCSACRDRHGAKLADVRVVKMPIRQSISRKSIERDKNGLITSVLQETIET